MQTVLSTGIRTVKSVHSDWSLLFCYAEGPDKMHLSFADKKSNDRIVFKDIDLSDIKHIHLVASKIIAAQEEQKEGTT